MCFLLAKELRYISSRCSSQQNASYIGKLPGASGALCLEQTKSIEFKIRLGGDLREAVSNVNLGFRRVSCCVFPGGSRYEATSSSIMPGIIVFKRRWSVGSDDLIVPAAFLVVIHTIW